ncbi:MAG: Cys-tRNA(Pro) deacylase [Clostridia bacterium]|nr:Cys-tRNA(Pro) deacylase [Clostridia bacterium]
MAKNDKTNVGRILESKKISFQTYHYEATGAVSGKEVAQVLGQNPERVFKTLVTVGKSKQHYVFVIPVEKELDLKKAAAVVGEKNIEMIPQKELLGLTGYVHGGCSPIGMKKFFQTTFDASAQNFESVFFSAGKIGFQVEVRLSDLEKVIPFQFSALTVQKE